MLAIAAVAMVVFWFFDNKKPSSNNVEFVNTVSPASNKTNSINTLNKEASPVVETRIKDDFSEFEQQVLTAQVQNIADRYADTARFPIGSQPIRNIADARPAEPFEETEVETPFETESGDIIGVSAAVDKFQYFSNETINVRLELSGLSEGVFVKATATIASQQGNTSLVTDLEAIDSSQSVLLGALNTSLTSSQFFSKEMFVKVFVEVDGEPFLTTVAFSYDTASAQLVGLGLVQPNGATLDIPFEYTVFQSGYYFVSALLQDQQTGQPLIALQTEGRMTQGNGQVIAQAHIQALKEAGSEGPYVLTNIKAYRGAERGEQFDVPASNVKSQFEIAAQPFSSYEDQAFEDPLAQERVEFLKELGNLENQTDDEQGGDTN